MKHLLEKLVSFLSYFFRQVKRLTTTKFGQKYPTKIICMTIHFPLCMSVLSERLVLAKRSIITSLAFVLAKDISDLSPATDNFLEGCICFSLQELNSPNGKNNDDEKLPVVGNTPVINNYVEWVPKFLLKDWFRLECILRALRGVHLKAALWKVFEIKLSASKDR